MKNSFYFTSLIFLVLQVIEPGQCNILERAQFKDPGSTCPCFTSQSLDELVESLDYEGQACQDDGKFTSSGGQNLVFLKPKTHAAFSSFLTGGFTAPSGGSSTIYKCYLYVGGKQVVSKHITMQQAASCRLEIVSTMSWAHCPNTQKK